MAKKLALTFGVVFIVVGLLGLIGGLGIVGPTGLFVTDTPHDLVHLLSGIVFVLVALAASRQSRTLLIVFGIVYLLVGVLGFFTPDGGKLLGLILINNADNYLHIVLGLAILIAGWSSDKANGTASRIM